MKKIYHGDGVVLTPAAKKQVKQLTDLGFGDLPICMAKTQYSFSDDPACWGAPPGLHGHRPQREGVRGGGLPGGPHRATS